MTTTETVIKNATLVERITRDDDLEIHIREIEFDGLALVDVREYIPSRELYGHGIMFPESLTETLHGALGSVMER